MAALRVSIGSLVAFIAFLSVGLAALQFASSPWAGVVFSGTLATLTYALLAAYCQRGGRRDAWVGFALFGWVYLTLTNGPWFDANVRPLMLSTKVIRWSYPWLVPDSRQPLVFRSGLQTFVIKSPVLGQQLAFERIMNSRVDVWVRDAPDQPMSPLIEDATVVQVGGSRNVVSRVGVQIDSRQLARLTQAEVEGKQFILARHSPGMLSAMWASPPVEERDFERVGHALVALLCAGIGAVAGRSMSPSGGRGETQQEVPGSYTP
ncbi:hypothetical protein ACYOEI_04060 [Singulisphaera rosea]